ncbi:hypothetical protein Tcan_05812 [Toxocara canis]|uniref:Uncharacterized protein n=1 Tax=Toxocara canis TaxID=6265 RepID=A0A0B2USW2_TOXCA|nr:hypothetical protein Tcan_05812 [Toxocara canis]
MLKFVQAPRSGNASKKSTADRCVSQLAQEQEAKTETTCGQHSNQRPSHPSHEEYETFVELLSMENKLLFEQRRLNCLKRQMCIDELCKQQLITEQIFKNHSIHHYNPLESIRQIQHKFDRRMS